MTDWRDMPSRDDEVRPYWGERESVIEGPPIDLRRPEAVYAASPQRRESDRLAEGKCGRQGCSELVEDFEEGCCKVCGWSLIEYRMSLRLARVEDKPDYAPTLSRLFADEYGPADATEDAA